MNATLRMHRALTIRAAYALLGAVLLMLAMLPASVAACAIDNTASLSANGVQAKLTTDAPTQGSAWAPFTFPRAFASGQELRVGEARADLARSLPPAVLAAPYRWHFGDGATALGHTVSHRYARPGTYRLSVYGYDARSRRWYQFDAGLLRIVTPGQVLQSNLGYYALSALDVVTGGLMWVIDAALVALVLFAIVRRRRRPHPRRADNA